MSSLLVIHKKKTQKKCLEHFLTHPGVAPRDVAQECAE